jgi:tetratricopeptide (TPR) repeat protein
MQAYYQRCLSCNPLHVRALIHYGLLLCNSLQRYVSAKKLLVRALELQPDSKDAKLGTQFTCFTGAKVQILTQKTLVGWEMVELMQVGLASDANRAAQAHESWLGLFGPDRSNLNTKHKTLNPKP